MPNLFTLFFIWLYFLLNIFMLIRSFHFLLIFFAIIELQLLKPNSTKWLISSKQCFTLYFFFITEPKIHSKASHYCNINVKWVFLNGIERKEICFGCFSLVSFSFWHTIEWVITYTYIYIFTERRWREKWNDLISFVFVLLN